MHHDEGKRFARGLLYAVPLAVAVWLLLAAVVYGVTRWLMS